MAPATPAQKRATVKHRAARRRIELLLDPESPEAKELDRLVVIHGSVAAAVRAALLGSAAASTVRGPTVKPPQPKPAANLKPTTVHLPVGPVPSKPGSRLIDKRPRR